MKCAAWILKVVKQVPKEFGFLYLVTFVLLLPILCIHMPHSLYHIRTRTSSEQKHRLDEDNLKRLAENLPIIQRYNESILHDLKQGPVLYDSNIDVGITIITVSRQRHGSEVQETQYLTQVVGQMLHLLNTTTSGRRYGLFLCNVDADPKNFKEIKPLKVLIPTFDEYRSKHAYVGSIFEKEKLDYVFCLEETLKRNASFTFLIEDDGYPHKDLMPVLERVIDNNLASSYPDSLLHENKLSRKVTYVKFYHPERLLGYISLEWERIPELIATSLLFGSFLTYCVLNVFQWKRNVKLIWLMCVVYFCLITLIIGRANLLEIRRISPQLYQVTPAPSCCTPAMLFPRHGGWQIVNQLKAVKCRWRYGKDTALEDIRRKEGYIALMVQPNLFTHIGLFSSLRKGEVDPFIV